MADSNAILVYLALKFGRTDWLPEDPAGAAAVQRWLSVAAGQIAFGPAAARLITVFGASFNAEEVIARAHAILKHIDAELAGRAWLVGDRPTIADVALYSYIARAPEGNVDLTALRRDQRLARAYRGPAGLRRLPEDPRRAHRGGLTGPRTFIKDQNDGRRQPDRTRSTSNPPPPGTGERRRFRRASGLPTGWRHSDSRAIRDHMPDQHRQFYAQLPFIVAGSVDPQGDAWATLLTGDPGFIQSPDPKRLSIATHLDEHDPATAGMSDGDAIGLLGIELHTRRRNRLNGTVRSGSGECFRRAGGAQLRQLPPVHPAQRLPVRRRCGRPRHPQARAVGPSRCAGARPDRRRRYLLRRLLCRSGGRAAAGRCFAPGRQAGLRPDRRRWRSHGSRVRGQPLLQHAGQFPAQPQGRPRLRRFRDRATCFSLPGPPK